MRTILKCNRFTSIKYMLDTLKWLNVKQNTTVFIQKMKMKCAPEYLTEQLRYVGEVLNPTTFEMLQILDHQEQTQV